MKKNESIKYWGPVSLAVILFAIYLYGNNTGTRYCNCKSTENWQPGEAKQGNTRSGRTHFYHK